MPMPPRSRGVISWLSALSLLLFLSSLSGGLAQAAEQALTLDVIINSLQKGLSPARAAALVKERGVNFQLTKAQEDRLRAAGADDRLIADIRRAGEEYARRTKAEEERKGLEEERRKIEEERRKIEEARKKAEEVARRVEEERKMKAEEERKKLEEEKRRAEEERTAKLAGERKKLEEERAKLEEERKKAEEIARKADEEKKKAEELAKKRVADIKEGRVAPVFREGNLWHFRAAESDYRTPPKLSVHGIYEVVFSGGRLQVFKLTGNQRQAVLGAEAANIRRLLGTFRDDAELLRFPLFVGQKWTNTYLNVQGALRNVESHVATVEKVTTPAGTYQSFKIERRDEAAEKGNPAVLTYFYSPETGSVVKYTLQNFSPRGPGGKREIELIKFGSGR